MSATELVMAILALAIPTAGSLALVLVRSGQLLERVGDMSAALSRLETAVATLTSAHNASTLELYQHKALPARSAHG